MEIISINENRLTIISNRFKKKIGKENRWYVRCKCICGNIIETRESNIINGNTKSCGCLRTEEALKGCTTHGLRYHKLYAVWIDMKTRCYNKNHKDYKDYGGRGIIVYKEWLSNFKNFFDWSIENGWYKGLVIDRRNVNGNYEPNNIRFITQKESQNNKRNTVKIQAFNEIKSISEWIIDSRCKVNRSLLYTRITNGWNTEIAITTQPYLKLIYAFDEWKTPLEWSKDSRCKVNSNTLKSRIQRKWNVEEAITTPSKK